MNDNRIVVMGAMSKTHGSQYVTVRQSRIVKYKYAS